MRTIAKHSLTVVIAALLSACGTNFFATGEEKDPAEDATIALDDGDPTKAINILEDALEGDPDNAQYLSILSTAYAQRAGIDLLTMVRRMIEDSGDDEEEAAADEGSPDSEVQSTSSGFTALWSVVPEPTESVLSDIDRAVEILTSEIPYDQHQPGDDFKLGLYQTASITLHTKALDLDGDGALSIEEIINLSDTSAAGLLNQLAQASAVLSGADPDDETKQKAAETITQYQSQIDATEGETQEEKLRNYLAASQGAG